MKRFPRSLPRSLRRLPATSGLRVLVISGLWVSTVPGGWSQPQVDALPRRGFFGVGLDVNDAGAVIVKSVLEGTTAAEAGIESGDIVKAVDGVVMQSTAETMAAIGAHSSGDRVTIDVERGGTVQGYAATLKPYPVERMAGADVAYGSVALENGTRLRTIVSVPTGDDRPAPAVLLIQGGGCGSVDLPWPTPSGYYPLIHMIGSNGFVTMRVEKSGVGDSDGPPCDSIGYYEELAGYQAALRALKLHPAVDPNRVFLVGISLGGVFAPILANETKVAGISVYGTIAFAPRPYPGRSRRFFDEFKSVDVAAEWARIDVPVQALYGEYDEVTARDSAEKIVETVNGAHPGLAEEQEFAKLDHCTTRHATREASVGHCGAGDATNDVNEAMLAFLRRIAKG